MTLILFAGVAGVADVGVAVVGSDVAGSDIVVVGGGVAVVCDKYQFTKFDRKMEVSNF